MYRLLFIKRITDFIVAIIVLPDHFFTALINKPASYKQQNSCLRIVVFLILFR